MGTIYLSSFALSDKRVKNPNVYPYCVFRDKDPDRLVFAPVTVFYGNNGSGKSTLLNIIADKLELKGRERATSNTFALVDYCGGFTQECSFSYGDNEEAYVPYRAVPPNSRYVKSEDILYEIKKIQQRQVLADGMVYDYVKKGMTTEEAKAYLATKEGSMQQEFIEFAQEKYSNGETAMQYFEDFLQPDGLYLLDEPEVSLSPANQVKLAEKINYLARFLKCQFLIATHSPFMLGTLEAKIYNMDTREFAVAKWSELENVRFFYDFFKKHEDEFLDQC